MAVGSEWPSARDMSYSSYDPGFSSIPKSFRKHAYSANWPYVNPSSHGQGFVNTIRSQLPEISGSHSIIEMVSDALATTLKKLLRVTIKP